MSKNDQKTLEILYVTLICLSMKKGFAKSIFCLL